MNFRKGKGREDPEINLIPFIDVLLVILIFLMVSTTYSKFTELQITLPTADAEQAKEKPQQIDVTIDAKGNLSSGKFEADMTTIKNTDVTSPEYSAKLDGHLKSEDFFGVEKFPKATFVLTKVAKIAKGNALVKGNMTIKGKTVPIEFKAVFQEAADGMKVYANITLDRTKFDIRYGSGSFFENLGDKTIYDDFNITLTLVNKKK